MANKGLLERKVVAALESLVPAVAKQAREALASEIAEYRPEIRGSDEVGEASIVVALEGWLRLVELPAAEADKGADPTTIDAAYDFGRFEAANGRTPDALLGAYRVGARVCWRNMSDAMIDLGVDVTAVSRAAELLLVYIDQLSAASLAGHTDQLASVGRARDEQVARLARRLLEGAPVEELAALADAAGWEPPQTLAAVILPAPQARPALHHLDPRTLLAPGDLAPGLSDTSAVLLVPDAHRDRQALLLSLAGHRCTVGPSRPWDAVAASYRRALRADQVLPRTSDGPLDTEAHLATLAIGADEEVLADLRARVLGRFDGLRPATAARLAETLRSWLLHQGRRDDVAADLNVHAQTIRYRMGQIRDRFADQLATPDGMLELVVALATLPVPDEQDPPDAE